MAASTSRHWEAPDSVAAVMTDRLDAPICDLTVEETELVAAASSLMPVQSANAETADATRRRPEGDIKALREAGLFRLATPRAYGGHEAGARAATAIAAELGRGCSSASWVLVVFYSATLALWLLPDRVRHQVWAQDPDATVCLSAGAAPARRADGGWLLSGRWGWASGVHHAPWAIVDIVTGAGVASPDRGVRPGPDE